MISNRQFLWSLGGRAIVAVFCFSAPRQIPNRHIRRLENVPNLLKMGHNVICNRQMFCGLSANMLVAERSVFAERTAKFQSHFGG
jgi:hypothetical protein